MNIRNLINRLEKLAEELGDNAPVVVLDGEGEWAFSIHVEPQLVAHGGVMMVCLDITGEPE